LSFFGSNFIARLPRVVFVAVGGMEGSFLSFARLVLEVITHECLYDRHEGTGDHDEVVVKGTNDFKKRVIAGHDLARLNPGDVPLANAETACQIPLTPSVLRARLYQGATHFGGQRLLS